MSDKPQRYDGLGIAMLGLTALMLVGLAAVGFIRAPSAPEEVAVQQSMAWASWAMVVVSVAGGIIGALSLYLIYRTLQAAQRSAIAAEATVIETRVIGKAQTRAYMAVFEGLLSVEGARLGALFKFKNSGQTPAQHISTTISIFLQFEKADDSLVGFETPRLVQREQRPRSDTPSQAEKNCYIHIADTDGFVAEQDLRYCRVLAEIVVQYSDVFGDGHQALAQYEATIFPGEVLRSQAMFRATGLPQM